ncbi:hypothetical protein Tco_1439248 [Tanacetum coccineum]
MTLFGAKTKKIPGGICRIGAQSDEDVNEVDKEHDDSHNDENDETENAIFESIHNGFESIHKDKMWKYLVGEDINVGSRKKQFY